jgi:hypothetical protein
MTIREEHRPWVLKGMLGTIRSSEELHYEELPPQM